MDADLQEARGQLMEIQTSKVCLGELFYNMVLSLLKA